MKHLILAPFIITSCLAGTTWWTTDTQEEWEQNKASQTSLTFRDGMAEPTKKSASYTSKIKSFKQKHKPVSIEVTQSPIWQNWDPIKASTRSRDSPLDSHAVSKDGVSFKEKETPAVDYRTTPTGKTGTYKHPHWVAEGRKNYKSKPILDKVSLTFGE